MPNTEDDSADCESPQAPSQASSSEISQLGDMDVAFEANRARVAPMRSLSSAVGMRRKEYARAAARAGLNTEFSGLLIRPDDMKRTRSVRHMALVLCTRFLSNRGLLHVID
jgi:hypothetical protein